MKGLQGESVTEYAYVEGQGEHARFFAQPIVLGKNGVEALLPIGTLSAYEQKAMNDMLGTLKADIELGVEFVNKA